MKITRAMLLKLRGAAEAQRVQHIAAANAAAGQIALLDEQLAIIKQPEPTKKKT